MGINLFLEVLLFGNHIIFNTDHKLWHNYSTLRMLLKEYGFKVHKGYYTFWKDYQLRKKMFGKNGKIVFFIRHLIMKFFISLRKDFCPNFLFVFKLE